MKIKMIALDVDGTLFNSKGQVLKEVEEAIAEAHKNDILITLLSGRTRYTLEPLSHRLNIKIPYAGANGAFAAQPDKKKPLYTMPLKPEDVTEVSEKVLCNDGVGIVFHYLDKLYFDPLGFALTKSWHGDDAAWAIKEELHILMKKTPPPLKLELVGNEENLSKIASELSGRNLIVSFVFGPKNLEINSEKANKGTGLTFLSDHLHIPLEHIAACGDGMNDKSMLTIAGYSFAMGNAHPEIKKIANFIAPTNDEAGTAWVIKKALELNSH